MKPLAGGATSCLLVLLECFLLGCTPRPNLRLARSGDKIVVHVETLGEYPTFVKRIRLSDEDIGSTIFEALGTEKNSELYNITFSAGDNSIDLSVLGFDSYYRVLTPTAGKTFRVQPGKKYRLQMWGQSPHPSEATIEFPR
jgi:hypothetical protein